jgi:aryl-alcohol dehydrogenase-like predicted oxidoreductase
MNQRLFGGAAGAAAQTAVSEVGLGTWQIGGSWGEVSEDEALAILRQARERGVTVFDTADVYGGGKSESLIGRFLRETNSDVFVATKLGRSAPGGPENYTLATMRAHTEASLARLGVEALDLTQLHCVPTEVLARGEVFDSLRALQQEGKIRRFGASVESMEEAHICLQQEGLASLQIIFNILRQKPIEALFEAAQQKGVALIVRLPLASGLLSGKMKRDTQFGPEDHRNFNRDGASFNVGETFSGLPFEKGVELADALKPLVPEGMTMAQMSLRWILDFPAVTTVIPGASSAAQVESNVSASALPPLSRELHDKLRELYQTQAHAHIRGPY